MADTAYVRIWEIKLARNWVHVTITVHGPSDDVNATPANLVAVGIVLARIGKALDRIQKWAIRHTTFEKQG